MKLDIFKYIKTLTYIIGGTGRHRETNKIDKNKLFSEIWKKHALKDSSGLNEEEIMLHRLNAIKKTLDEMKSEYNADTSFYPTEYFIKEEFPKFNNNKKIVLAVLKLHRGMIIHASEEIKEMCPQEQDPVEALTIIIEIESNYAELQAELPSVIEVVAPTPRKKVNKL